MSHELEEGNTESLDFTKLTQISSKKLDVLPVIVQDANSKEVLILAYANRIALDKSIESNLATFWSTSRNELWVKGSSSGDYLNLVEIRINCEQNSLLYLVRPQNQGSCHTVDTKGQHRQGCYYRKLEQGQLTKLSE